MFDFLKNELDLFIEDMSAVKNFFSGIFGKKEKIEMLNEASIVPPTQTEEQKLELEIANELNKIMGEDTHFEDVSPTITADNIDFGAIENDNNEEVVLKELFQEEDVPEVYVADSIDNNIVAYLGEDIASIRNSMSGNVSQHEILREYAQYFKPYSVNAENCNAAFKKYYDRNALDIGQSKISVDQMRIIQNNVDVFIKGEEGWDKDECFIDSRIDDIFRKVGDDQVRKVVNCLSESSADGINLNGERLLAESLEYMISNSIKVGKDHDLVAPVKRSIEDKLVDVRVNLAKCEVQDENFSAWVSDERKYLYALNRIDKYEREKIDLQYEQNLEEIIME